MNLLFKYTIYTNVQREGEEKEREGHNGESEN